MSENNSKNQKISFSQIIESLEARWFMSSMATGAMGIFTFLVAMALKISALKFLAFFLIFLAFGVFIVSSVLTIIRLIKFPKSVLLDTKHPVASNFFAGISISAGVLSTAVSNVLIPAKILPASSGSILALVLYIIAIVLGGSFYIMVSSNLIKSEKTKSNHAMGVWLLPPVGIFVAIFAGNFASPHLSLELAKTILMTNLFIFGIALFGYFYTMNMIFHRIKFHPLPPAAMAPSFLIPLAPVGVSVIALFSLMKGISLIPGFSVLSGSITSFFLLYTPFIIGFGFFWIISTFLIIKHYLKIDGIPFSLGFWAFVFPLDAFGIGLFLVSKNPYFSFLLPVAIAVWVLSIAVWIYVSSKTFCAMKSGKAFQRPKSVQAQPEGK